jgi:heme exporter protein CcmD
MDMSSPHFGFVAASYALSAAVLAGLVIWTFWRKRHLDTEAKRLLKSGE